MMCLVDSEAGVSLLDAAMAGVAAPTPLSVLVELGAPGGRAGVRSDDELDSVVSAVTASRRLRLAGVEGYEGVVGSDRSPAVLSRVDAYLARIRDVAEGLSEAGAFYQASPPVVSAGGSKYFDRVAAVLGPAAWPGIGADVVLRSGCYVTHDSGHYAEVSPLGSSDAKGRRLLPAIELWADVLSVPEGDRAIVGFGKRDTSFDLGLPVPVRLACRDGSLSEAAAGMAVTGLDDQHAYLDTGGRELRVGDRLGFGLSHPCTAFDKWRVVPVVSDDYVIVDAVMTFF